MNDVPYAAWVVFAERMWMATGILLQQLFCKWRIIITYARSRSYLSIYVL